MDSHVQKLGSFDANKVSPALISERLSQKSFATTVLEDKVQIRVIVYFL